MGVERSNFIGSIEIGFLMRPGHQVYRTPQGITPQGNRHNTLENLYPFQQIDRHIIQSISSAQIIQGDAIFEVLHGIALEPVDGYIYGITQTSTLTHSDSG